MKKIGKFILALFVLGAYSGAVQAKIPSSVASLILEHQPYLDESLLQAGHDWSFIKRKAPEAILEGSIVTLTRNKNRTVWRIDNEKRVTQVTFFFGPATKSALPLEKKVLLQYKAQLTPEVFSRVPSSTRTAVVKDSQNKIELEVFFPVSDYDSPKIRAVTVFMPRESDGS